MHKKGWIPSPATMLWFLCEQHTCRGGTGKQPHQWALSEGAACRTALGPVLGPVGSLAAPGQGYPALLPEEPWDELNISLTLAPPRGAAPPPWLSTTQPRSALLLFHFALTSKCWGGGAQTQAPQPQTRVFSCPHFGSCPPRPWSKARMPWPSLPSLPSWWVQTSSFTAFLRDARKLSAPKGMAVTRTKCWLSLDLVRKGMCRFHSNPQMQWVLAFLSTSPSPSFPTWLPNGKAHYS